MAFAMAGYQLIHHGEGRWNGVAIAAREGLSIGDVVTNFGDGPVRDSGPGGAGGRSISEEDFDPFDEARMLAATVDGLRVVSLYAPERPGRRVAVLRGQARLVRAAGALDATRRASAEPSAARPRRRPQRGPDRSRRVGCRGRPRRHARVGARTSGVPRAARPWPDRWLPARSTTRPAGSRGGTTGRACSTRTSGMRIDHLLAIGAGRGADRRCRDRPRGAQGPAGPVRPRAADRSTSTSRAARSIRTGRAPSPASRQGRSRPVARPERLCYKRRRDSPIWGTVGP